MSKKLERAQIPFQDYLGLYCKAWQRLQKKPDQVNLAFFVLSKHLLIEKSRNTYKRKGQNAMIFEKMTQVQNDSRLADTYSYMLTKDSPLAKFEPLFVKAGLI